MPLDDISPAELEVLIEQMHKRIDLAFNEAYQVSTKIIEKAYNEGWNTGGSDVKKAGFPFDVPPDIEALDFLKNYQFDLIKGVSEDIKKDVARVIRDAVANGWSIPRTSRELKQVLQRKKWRLNTIARTEVMRAANTGRLNAYKKSGVVKGKEWLTAFDDRTCPECASCDGMRAPLEKPFPCGVMAPPLHPNCRCTITPIFYDEKLARGGGEKELVGLKRRPGEMNLSKLELAYSTALWRAFREAIKDCTTMVRKGGFL